MKAVLFDMDGVIFDTERIWIECWSPVGKRHGLNGIETLLREQCIGITYEVMERILRDAYGETFDYDLCLEEASEVFRERYGRNIPMKPGVREILSFLKERSVPLALASSSESETVRSELTDAGLIDFFDVVVGGEQVPRSKPAPDLFLLAARLLGVEPESCFVIEDSFNGIRAASAAGMHPIMVPDLLSPDREMKDTAEAILPSLVEAAGYLRDALEKDSAAKR